MSGPDFISAPKGSKIPIFVFVPSITVLTIFALNCGSLKTQSAFKDLIFDLILIIRFADAGNSGSTSIEPTDFKL